MVFANQIEYRITLIIGVRRSRVSTLQIYYHDAGFVVLAFALIVSEQ